MPDARPIATFMTTYLFANHLLNFVAPAAFMAVVLAVLSRTFGQVFRSKRLLVHALWAQIAINFVFNVAVLAVGLIIFGNDGKMATYAAMAIAAALCQWVLLRGWQR